MTGDEKLTDDPEFARFDYQQTDKPTPPEKPMTDSQQKPIEPDEKQRRIKADALIAPFVIRVDGIQQVALVAAQQLLGDVRYRRMLRDPIRRWGPTDGVVYPWNIADFLVHPDLGADKDPPAAPADSSSHAALDAVVTAAEEALEHLAELGDGWNRGMIYEIYLKRGTAVEANLRAALAAVRGQQTEE